jgi:hypothetical protein
VSAPRFGRQEFIYLHETYSNGKIVAVLPFRQSVYGYQFLVRREIVPSWDIDAPALCAITGLTESEDPEVDALRELYEESGFVAPTRMLALGTCRGIKAADTVYSLFAVDLTGIEPAGPGRGTNRIEAEGDTVWLTINQLVDVTDAQVHVMYVRLLPHLLRGVSAS